MDMTIVTLTLTTTVSLLALLVGGMIGWMARQHSYETTPQIVYTHPEMYDENGNLIPDEILAVRFEQHDTSEDTEEDEARNRMRDIIRRTEEKKKKWKH